MWIKKKVKEMRPKKEVTVQEIHDEFDSAVDSIVEQANEILARANQEDRETADKLDKLGFSNIGLVKQYREINESEKESKELSKYSAYYQEKYGLKFISESLVKKICQKYGLVIGLPSDFIGEIPLKNRKEILDFQLDSNDYWRHIYIYGGFGGFIDVGKVDSDKEAIDRCKDLPMRSWSSGNRLEIVGTVDQFDLKDKIISDYEIKSKDPIVLQECKGGYLIISKWGNEENIKEL